MRLAYSGGILAISAVVLLLCNGIAPVASSSARPRPEQSNSELAGIIVQTEVIDNTLAGTGQDQESSIVSDLALNLNDPHITRQWALNKINISALWNFSPLYPDVVVAILDTGIDKDHEDLVNRVIGEANFTGSPTPDDLNGHGTHVAGIIAANRDNGIGISGIGARIKLLNVKVADDRGFSNALQVARGIMWAVENGAQVINVSIELKDTNSDLEAAVKYAWEKGVVIVAAAGNRGSHTPVYPAAYEHCIAVTATDEANKLAPLANDGEWVDVAAPGFQIFSTLPDNCYGYQSGTSFASAIVSGISALYFSILADNDGNGLVNDEVRSAIIASCRNNPVQASNIGWLHLDRLD